MIALRCDEKRFFAQIVPSTGKHLIFLKLYSESFISSMIYRSFLNFLPLKNLKTPFNMIQRIHRWNKKQIILD